MDQWDLARTRLRRGPWNDETVNDIPQNMDPGKAAGQAAVEAAVMGVEAVDALPELPDTQYDAGKVVVLSTNDQQYRSSASADAWTLAIEGPVQQGTSAYVNHNVYNGDFSIAPLDPTAILDNTVNPLPGWTLVDTSAGGITATWTADATVGAGAYILFTKSADATGTLFLQQDVIVRSSASRNAAAIGVASLKRISASPPDDNLIQLSLTELDSDGTSLGTYATGQQDINSVASVTDMKVVPTASFNAATTYLRLDVGFTTSTDSATVRQAGLYDCNILVGDPYVVFPDLTTPTNAPDYMNKQGGKLLTSGTLTPALLTMTGPVDLSASSALLLPQGTVPAQTAEGSIKWDTDDDHLTVGTGAGRVTMLDTGSSTYATPSLTLGTANAAGAATTIIRSDATILAFDATTPAAVGTAAVGVATVAARRDHVHATGAGTPASVSTANATGTGPAAAMTDHVHAHETAHVAHDTIWDAAGDLVQGTGSDTAAKLAISAPAANILNVVGVVNGETSWSVKSVHDSTAPTTSALGDAAAAGTSLLSAHRDHTHGRESFGTTTAAVGTSAGGSATTPSKSDHVHATGAGTPSTQALGDAAATGSGPAAAMTDHKHAMPTAAITTSGLTIATATVAGRATAGTGAIEALATTGSGSVVLATSPTLVTPLLGTPTSGVMTNVTGLPLGGMANLAANSIIGNNTGSPATPLALTAANVRALLALVIGTNVQAWDADLDTLAAATVGTGGTFTPALAFATVGSSSWATTTAVGFYTRLLDRVIFNFTYQGVPTNGTGAGNLQLSGLPVTSNSTATSGARFAVEFQGYTKANFTQITGFVNVGVTTATFRASGSAQTTAALQVADIPTGGTVIVAGGGHYLI